MCCRLDAVLSLLFRQESIASRINLVLTMYSPCDHKLLIFLLQLPGCWDYR